MPWCEACAKFWNPSTMTPDGACPACGRVLAVGPTPTNDVDERTPADGRSMSIGDVRRMAAGGDGDTDESDVRAPWHFKLMVVALVVYLGYRAYQLIAHFL